MAYDIFNRSSLLLGEDVMKTLASIRVIVFGVGGVGSWCVESLVRTGVKHITIVDSDRVADSNVNRQLMATTKTIGAVKVDALKSRLLEINPEADVCAVRDIYCADTTSRFNLAEYDYVIDAIDSLENKALLILNATSTKPKPMFFSSMGAALKTDPTKIDVAEFWKVSGCPLGAALRRRFKRCKTFPIRKFRCVYSPELLENKRCDLPPEIKKSGNIEDVDWNARKAQINGSLPHVTAVFGFTLASLVVNDVMMKTSKHPL